MKYFFSGRIAPVKIWRDYRLTVQNELLIKLNHYLKIHTARQNDAKGIRITINVSDPTALSLKLMIPHC